MILGSEVLQERPRGSVLTGEAPRWGVNFLGGEAARLVPRPRVPASCLRLAFVGVSGQRKCRKCPKRCYWCGLVLFGGFMENCRFRGLQFPIVRANRKLFKSR